MANPNPSLDNLRPKPWLPGQSGNPAGYSAGRRLMTRLEELIDSEGVDDKVLTALVGAAVGDDEMLKGRKPQAQFMAMLLERLAGKPTQPVEHGGDLKIVIEYADTHAEVAPPAPSAGPHPD